MSEYERLEATCADELPVAPLLQLLGRCSDAEAICASVDCTGHGNCTTVNTCDDAQTPVCDAGGHPGGAGYMQSCNAEVGCRYNNGVCAPTAAWSSTTALIPPNADLFGGMDVVILDAANAGQAVQWPSGGLTSINGQSNQVFNFPKYIPGGASGGLGDPLSAWATDGATEPILSGDVVAFYHPATDQLFDCSGGSCNVQVFPLPAGHWGSSMRMYKLGGSVGDPILMCDSIYFDRMVNGAFDGGASLSATTSSIRGVGTMAARTVFTLAQTTTGSCELPPPAEPACLPAGSCVCEDGWQGDSCQFP